MTSSRAILFKVIGSIPLVGIVPWCFFLLLLPMMFSAPGSKENLLLWMGFYSILFYPVFPICGTLLTFDGIKNASNRMLMFGILISYSGPALVFGSFFCIRFFCQGNTVCRW